MQLTVSNGLGGCPEDCMYHSIRCEYDEIKRWGGALKNFKIDVWCEHEKICKLRKEAENGEEHNAV